MTTIGKCTYFTVTQKNLRYFHSTNSHSKCFTSSSRYGDCVPVTVDENKSDRKKWKSATARLTAIWPFKQKGNVPLNNRHEVNNSASITVRLRESFLIFMWHDSQDRNSCSRWARCYSYCEAQQCFVIHSLGFRPSKNRSRPTKTFSSKLNNSRGFVIKFWTDVCLILRNIPTNGWDPPCPKRTTLTQSQDCQPSTEKYTVLFI